MRILRSLLFGIVFVFLFNVYASSKMFFKDVELVDIIIFNDFTYEDLKDEYLKKNGIDSKYVNIFTRDRRQITENNYKNLLTNFENILTYEYKDVFGKKFLNNRKVYIFSKHEFLNSVSLDYKYKMKNIIVDVVYGDSTGNRMLVGKIFSEPKLPENKNCYIIKLDRNNKIVWGKIFEDTKINKFNKIINVSDNRYCLIGSGYRNSEWTDGFIVKFDDEGNFIWKNFYGSSHIDDFKDIVYLEDGSIVVLAEVSNNDGDVTASVSINNPLNKDLVLVKYDTYGNIVWQNSVSNENEITALKIMNEENNVIVFGEVTTKIDGDNVKNIIVSGFDVNGKIKFSTIVSEHDDELLNNYIKRNKF